ncbi:hypothetical protein BEWA_008270 [Theileria equi strain WA]|uniref:E3 ubiquitin-protein ligase n=1 Tax=Theileria equi strain WA TaxID=1537102 RepID=L0B0Q1_THEEQ|nr:hypothetical protein BEWA_008270 [Theileria equi strain WA]AFZ81417.1 hypothetical protein BEWA_008270 [Theileria equi strain WA]|eukprot:XP_004831083.1 hypothetical protein BEWA_008270 [Theileria equi strain WA]
MAAYMGKFSLRKLCKPLDGLTRDSVFNDLYAYLYGTTDRSKIDRYLRELDTYSGFCITKWLEETVAIKCYDCEYDSTCAICLECFFESNHSGHEYRLTRTSGGCCDCGDISSWDSKGSCSKHTNVEGKWNENDILESFHLPFLDRFKQLTVQIMEYLTNHIKNPELNDEFYAHVFLAFLNELAKTTAAFRYALHLYLPKETLKDWLIHHQGLADDFQRGFSTLYLTLLTSPSFKQKFADVFASIYDQIVEPLHDPPEDWHLGNLSVQIFTYYDIALRLVKESFMDICLKQIMDTNLIDKRLSTVQFNRFDRPKLSFYIRIITDFTYLVNHHAVCELILSNENLQLTIFNLLMFYNNMNLIEREDKEHVSFENSGFPLAFTIEHTLHSCLMQFSDYCKGLPSSERPRVISFYKNLNKFILDSLETLKNFGNKRFCRSFHIPIVRFFAYMLDFNHVREEAKKFVPSLFDKSSTRVSEENFLKLKNAEIFNIFDTKVLDFVLISSMNTIRFAMEVKHNLWIYNGESMHDQRSNYFELLFHSFDIVSVQISLILLSVKHMNDPDFDVFSLFLSENFGSSMKTTQNLEVDTHSHTLESKDKMSERNLVPPGDGHFNVAFFCYFMNVVVTDIKHVEILSIPRKVLKEEYIRRGYSLMKMDVVNILSSGNTEFTDVVYETKKYWKHHPKLVESIEDVASINYSKVSDKTYVRLKSESYKIIDVLWNPHSPKIHSITTEALNHDISLFGSNSTEMSKEYLETQTLLLHNSSGYYCYAFIISLFTNICRKNYLKNGNNMQFPTLIDVVKNRVPSDISKTSFSDVPIVILENKWNESVLYCLKVLGLMIQELDPPNKSAAKSLVRILEDLHDLISDKIIKTAITFIVNKLGSIFQFDDLKRKTADITNETDTVDVKSIQTKYLQRMFTKQKTFIENTKLEVEDNKTKPCCILCKQIMKESECISYFCFISVTNVLRRCVSSCSILDQESNVNAKLSFPLTSTVITTCGHTAHTKCIYSHRDAQPDTQNFSAIGIKKTPEEFFCPICKFLCNFTLKYIHIPENLNRSFCKSNNVTLFNTHNVECFKIGCEARSIDMQIAHVAIHRNNDLVAYAYMTSWRYPYTTYWIPSPIFARYECLPHIVYALTLVAQEDIMDLDFSVQPKNIVEDLGFDCEDGSIDNIKCGKCKGSGGLSSEPRRLCSAVSTKDNENTILNIFNVTSQNKGVLVDRLYNYFLENWETYKNTRVAKILGIKSSATDFEAIPKSLLTSYCKSIFSSFRTFFGVQNWRHANAGVRVDTKVWLIYNELLRTCSLNRNTLNLPDSLFSQLVRNTYFDQLRACPEYKKFSTDDIWNRKIVVDTTYFDAPSLDIQFPGLECLAAQKNNGKTDKLRVFLESLDKNELKVMMMLLHIEIPEESDDVNLPDEYSDLDCFNKYENDSCSEDDMPIQSPSFYLKKIRDGKLDGNQVYEMFGYCLPPNPWSLDYIREFLVFFLSNKNATITDILEQLYYFITVAALQIFNKYIISLIRTRYLEFVKEFSDETRRKIDFLNSLKSKYFESFFESGGFPIDTMEHIPWMDFEKNRDDFKRFNGYKGDENAKRTLYNTQESGRLSSRLSEVISFVSTMQNAHDNIVSAFTEEIPTKEGSFGDKIDVDSFLVRQIQRLMEVRELHTTPPNKYKDILIAINDIVNKKFSAERTRDYIFKSKYGYGEIEGVVSETAQFKSSVTSSIQPYKFTDFVKRLNFWLYRNHSNVAFFETIRFHMPKSWHILDLISTDVVNFISQDDSTENADFFKDIHFLFDVVVKDLSKHGYLPENHTYDYAYLKNILEDCLNFFMDIAFWAIHSIYPMPNELSTKITYGNLHSSQVRFQMLFDALELNKVCNRRRNREIWLMLFNEVYKKQLDLNRTCNMNVTPPIISNYSFVKMDTFLEELNWDLLKSVHYRNCPTCGLRPSNPLICLLCGSIICSNTECCHPIQESFTSRFYAELDQDGIDFKDSDIINVNDEEVLAHSAICGGGQGVYVSPYHCCTLYIDDNRKGIIPSIYTDDYGNSDLHGKVYGKVYLSKTRLENITNTICSGRLANELITHRRRLFSHLN